jgi:hypothetical protein
MLKNELKIALAALGTVFVPLFAQADQDMSSSSMRSGQQTRPGLVAGDIIEDGQLSSAYPASAALVCNDGWDVRISGKYLYWKWSQDDAVVTALVDQTSGITNGYNGNTSYLFQNPGYTSGFKVGLGFGLAGLDNWDLFSEYSWYRNTNTVSATGTASKALALDGVLGVINPGVYQTGTLTSEAKLGYQTLDFSIRRAAYFGKNFIARLGSGLRAQWISETYTDTASVASLTSPFSALAASSVGTQSSWQLGPNFTFDSTWMLGAGFSVLANIHTSVLYTSYVTNTDLTGTYGTTSFSGSINEFHNYGTIRPVVESFIGLGWGMYFCDNSFHFDLSVGYDFNVYFNQHVLDLAQGSSNVYLQGLNVGLNFDF